MLVTASRGAAVRTPRAQVRLATICQVAGATPLLWRRSCFTIPAMSIRQAFIPTLGLFLMLLAACGGTRDTRVSPDAPDTVTGTGLQSQDIVTMAVDMAAKIKASGVLAPGKDGERVSFFMSELRNDSSDTIDKEIILMELRTELSKAFGRQVKILDREVEYLSEANQSRRSRARLHRDETISAIYVA